MTKDKDKEIDLKVVWHLALIFSTKNFSEKDLSFKVKLERKFAKKLVNPQNIQQEIYKRKIDMIKYRIIMNKYYKEVTTERNVNTIDDQEMGKEEEE